MVTVTDTAGNVSNSRNIGTTGSFTVDATAPITTLTTTSGSAINSPFTATVSFPETMTGFTSGDVTLMNATISNFTASGTQNYSFLVTPIAQGTVNATITGSVAQDLAGNGNTFASLSRVYDSTAPIIAEVTAITGLTNDNTPDYTFLSTETGTISYSGACTSVTTIATPGNNIITLSALADGSYSACTVQVTDAAGNISNTRNLGTFTVDATAPVAVMASTSGALVNSAFSVTVDFSESVLGFTGGDIVLSNASLSNFTASGTYYSFLVTPSLDGLVTVAVGTGAATDAATNNSNAVSLSRSADITAPTIAEITGIPSLTNDNTPNYTFFSTETGAINFSGACSSLIATATPGANTIALSLLADGAYTNCTLKITDAAGNISNTRNLGTFTVDATAPLMLMVSSSGALVNSPFTVTAYFSESVLGFTGGDIVLSNASLSNFTASGTYYSFLVTPSLDGLVTLNVATGASADAATNPSNATMLSRSADMTLPVIAEITGIPSLTNDNTPNYTFSSTETGTISYSGACTSPTTIATPGANTITLNSLTDGSYSNCTIKVIDPSGNISNTRNFGTFTVDATAPTTTITT